MLQVQSHANKLLSIVFDFVVTEEAAVSILDQYPELAWLAHCLQRCPMPPCWTSVDVEQDEARYVDMESGDMTDTPPLMKQFAEMATLMLQWRQSPTSAGAVGKELAAIHKSAVDDAARARRVWSGPHVDNETGAKFWHCEASGRSTWGDPSAAAEFLARVAERLKRALPVPFEEEVEAASSAEPPKKVAESVVAIAEAAAAAEARSAPERNDSSTDAADTANAPETKAPAVAEPAALTASPAKVKGEAGDAGNDGTPSKKLGGTGEMIRARTAEVKAMMAKISTSQGVKEEAKQLQRETSKENLAKRQSGKNSPKPGKNSPTPRAPTPPVRPSPRTPRRGVATLAAQEASNSGFGGLGNKVYLEAAAEVRGPKAGVWRPGASRPNLSARRRPSQSEAQTLEPLNSSRAPSQAKQVTILEKDGVTAVRPGRDTPEAGASEVVNDSAAAAAPSSRPTSARRAGTPARPKTRRGDDEIQRPWTPRATGELPDEAKPQPVRPGSALGGTHGREQLSAQEDAVVTASPSRSSRLQPGASLGATGEFSKDTDSDDAECVEMAADSPLGNTGCARHLCDIAIAAAVDAATAQCDDLGETQQFIDTQPLSPMRSMRMSKALGAEVMTFDEPGDEAEAESPHETAPKELTQKLPRETDSEVAPKEVTQKLPKGADSEEAPNEAAPRDVTQKLPKEAGSEVAPKEVTQKLPKEAESEPVASKEVPQQGAEMGEPSTAEPPKGWSEVWPEAEAVMNNTQLSATLISIAGPCSPSPRKDHDSSYADSPSLVILEDPRFTPCKTLPRPASPQAPASPKTPKREPRSGRLSSRGRAEDRPIRCRSPEPLSARGRERLESERRELFQACWRNAQAVADDTATQANAAAPLNAPRGPRPGARGVRHVARGGA